MKKNLMMRAASVLLVAVMLTTCAISGTFAKYVTADDASDSARVAKWGVTVLATGTLFGQHYIDEIIADDAGARASVAISAGTDDLVAPGTRNFTGLALNITGTPEVDAKVTVKADNAAFQDIYLKGGNTYGVMIVATGVTEDNFGTYYIKDSGNYTLATSYDSAETYYKLNDEVTVATDYYPVVWTFGGANYTNVADLHTAVETKFNAAKVEANTSLDKTGTITWEWAFEQNNGADTILGNLIAQQKDAPSNWEVVTVNGTTAAPVNYTNVCNLEVAYNVEITVEQLN